MNKRTPSPTRCAHGVDHIVISDVVCTMMCSAFVGTKFVNTRQRKLSVGKEARSTGPHVHALTVVSS
jgi:hypothetical protein